MNLECVGNSLRRVDQQSKLRREIEAYIREVQTPLGLGVSKTVILLLMILKQVFCQRRSARNAFHAEVSGR